MNRQAADKISFSLRSRLILMIYILTFVTGFFCAWQSIRTSQNKIIENSCDMALNEQFRIGYAVKKMAENYGYTKEEEILYLLGSVRDSAMSYAEYYGGTASYRIVNDEAGTIYSNISDELLLQLSVSPKQDGTVSYYMNQHGDKNYIYVSSYVKIYQKLFRLDYIQDITNINITLRSLAKKIEITLFLTELFLFFALNLVIARGLKPLDILRKHALKIAEGEYDNRAEVIYNDEVGQLAVSVNKMTDAVCENILALQNTVHSKELLASNLSHEIKTPLTSIVAYSDYAAQKDINKEELHNILEYIRKEGQRVNALSDKILKWNSINSCNEINIKPCRPQKIIEQALYTLRPVAESKGQKIEVGNLTDIIYADESLLISLIINLCKNALNASGEGSLIRLTIQNKKVDELVIQVKDWGIGIDQDELEKITEPFYMVDKSRDRSKGGSGLGLSLCIAIAEAHDGKMEIESVFGEGTCITVSIPQKNDFTTL